MRAFTLPNACRRVKHGGCPYHQPRAYPLSLRSPSSPPLHGLVCPRMQREKQEQLHCVIQPSPALLLLPLFLLRALLVKLRQPQAEPLPFLLSPDNRKLKILSAGMPKANTWWTFDRVTAAGVTSRGAEGTSAAKWPVVIAMDEGYISVSWTATIANPEKCREWQEREKSAQGDYAVKTLPPPEVALKARAWDSPCARRGPP
eukprot:GHVT01068553.1.p1 GENE.GHVT01068553.1~~GHVT01068553.1.p1  ORF type:complete len:202 (+),score=19.83 GHVT01068553.1:434-1039(+)